MFPAGEFQHTALIASSRREQSGQYELLGAADAFQARKGGVERLSAHGFKTFARRESAVAGRFRIGPVVSPWVERWMEPANSC